MDGRVGDLRLTIRAPADRLVRVGPAARDFATRVLQRCDAILEERAPGRVILVRRLDMTWRLLEAALEHKGEIEAFAEEVANALDAHGNAAANPPSSEQDVVVFRDEADWRAAYLATVSPGLPSRAWYFAPLESEGEPPGRLRDAENRAVAEAVLTRLADNGRLPDVLAGLPATGLEDLARSLGTSGAPDGVARGHSEALAIVRRHLVAAVRARRSDGPESGTTHERADRATTENAAPATDAVASPLSAATGVSLPSRVRAPSTAHETRFGGLFYLLARCLELEIGEALWRACLPEGIALAQATAALLGPAAVSDRAPALFGGVAAETALLAVSPDQHAEIASAIVASLGVALPRRHLGALPATVLGLTGHGTGRLLVATTPGSPFALFAWPAPSPRATADGIRAFLAAWPPSAPPLRAVPELAALDRTGRLRPARKAVLSPHVLLPAAPSAEASALLAQAVGAVCHLFVARAGAAGPARAEDFVDDFLAVPGVVELGPESMTVSLPMARIDPRVRRAGLDADPGWVPWLSRRLRILFEEDEAGDRATGG